MEILLQILLLAVGFVMLIKGSDWFVDGSSGIATKFGIPQLVIGLTIVAMGTSAPEAAVSISAAFSGSADITIGNIVGSNILNILIILGISSIIVPIAVAPSTIRIEIPFMIVITIIMLLVGLDGVIRVFDGIIFLVLFAAYLAYLYGMAKKDKNKNKKNYNEDKKNISITKSFLFVIIGLALIIFGSNITVDAATKIAQAFGISERFIGLTIVALGTSLPELFTSVTAARKGNADIAIGNIVGSNIFNILFVIGISALIIPVPFASNFIFDSIIAIATGVILLLCSLGTKKLKRWSGITMFIVYVAYFVLIFNNQ